MPRKNKNLINDYIVQIKEDGKVSDGTITTYENIGKNMPINITTAQSTIVKKLKDFTENPNTLGAYLNLIILVRRANDMETDKLITLRNSLSDSIKETRKAKLDKLNDDLPTYEYIKDELSKLSGRRYIINYLFMNHGLRNKDINMIYVKKIPKEGEDNYITQNRGKTKLSIRDYKTEKSHGDKEINIIDKKFNDELKKLNLNDEEHLFTKTNGQPIKSVSTFNEKLLNLSIDKLGQNKLFKIVVKHLLNTRAFDELERMSKDRGTSMEVILKSYNLHNGKNNKVENDE